MNKAHWARVRTFALMLLIAAAALMFCSKSSPAYPINDWSDANIYFSVGKGMAGGQVVYRDLYDHKGPLIYALHALCALVSPLSFTGVYALECLCAAAFLYIAYRLMALLGVKRLLCVGVALAAVGVYASFSFQQGDSAEELCLPLMLYALYDLIRWAKAGGGRLALKRVTLEGALFGCVFWTKFTLCGAWAAYLIIICVSALRAREIKTALQYIGAFAAGFALSTLPWLIYFGLNGAIYDWLKVYLYDNLFLYSGGESTGLLSRFKAMAVSGWEWAIGNLTYTVLVALGMVWSAAKWIRGRKSGRDGNAAVKQGTAASQDGVAAADENAVEHGGATHGDRAPARECLCLWVVAAISAFGVFIGGKSYPYYGLALAFLCVPGIGYLLQFIERRLMRGEKLSQAANGILIGDAGGAVTVAEPAICAATASTPAPARPLAGILANILVSLCAVAACFALSPNVRESFMQPREQTMQYKLAAIIDRYESPTLLNYGFMDAGFYTAAGVTPSVKYFHRTNVPLQEMLSEQIRYIDEGVCDFVVTRGVQPESIAEHYELVADAESPGFWYERAYLYRRIGLKERAVQTLALVYTD